MSHGDLVRVCSSLPGLETSCEKRQGIYLAYLEDSLLGTFVCACAKTSTEHTLKEGTSIFPERKRPRWQARWGQLEGLAINDVRPKGKVLSLELCIEAEIDRIRQDRCSSGESLKIRKWSPEMTTTWTDHLGGQGSSVVAKQWRDRSMCTM